MLQWAGLSALSFFVNLGLTTLLHEAAGVSAKIAFAVSLCVVFLMNFVLLRYVIYAATAMTFRKQFAAFFLSSIGFRGVEYALFYLLLEAMGSERYQWAIVTVQVASFFMKFFFYRAIVFRRRRPSHTSEGCALVEKP